jgi:nitrous oxidase accessory protein NosD
MAMMTVLHVPETFKTIADAVAAAVAGDTILVEPGVYREKVRIRTEFIRVVAEEGQVLLDGQGEEAYGFLIEGAQGVEINGFSIRNYRRSGIAVRDGRFNRLVQNRIQSITMGEGIRVQGDGNLIWRNNVSGASGDGILVLPSDGNWVVENRAQDNGGLGILLLGGKHSAIVSNETCHNKNFGVASTGENTLVFGNSLIENGPGAEGALPGEHGAEQTGNAVVIRTRVLRNRLPGIVLSRRNTFVACNLVRGNRGTGIEVGATARFTSVQENRVRENQWNGLLVNGSRNLLLRNKVQENRPFDLVLNNPDNDLIENDCQKSNLPSLCEAQGAIPPEESECEE